MPNIKFNYLYRDGANYKNFGFVVFENPDEISLELLANIIQSKLIDETWFYANQWHLPILYLVIFNFELDPTWHEFESIEYTNETATTTLTLTEFINR
jgi:hypothetical protein